MNIRMNTARTLSALFTLAIIALFAPALRAQVSVAPLTLPRTQFLSGTGIPLSNGCVNFFATGTSTPQAIYADSNGVFQLANPLPLDAAGMADVWMTNTGYDIVANAGVVNTACSVLLGAQLWIVKNKNPFSVINFGSNFIVASGTSDPSGSAGMLAYRTDLGKFRGFGTIWDSFIEETIAATLTNKTLDISANTLKAATNTAGNYPRNNGSQYVDSNLNLSDAVTNYTNSGTTPTVNGIAKLTGAGLATSATITDTFGFVGICHGTSCATGGGTSAIQSSGIGVCTFDGATTANDYVQNSTTAVANCHDTGVAPPAKPPAGQVVGQVLSTNAGNGNYSMLIYPPGITLSINGAAVGCTNFTPVTGTNNNALQNLLSCTIPANVLVQGSMLRVDLIGVNTTASAMTITMATNLGGGTICSTISGTTGVATNQPFHVVASFAVLTAGAGGTGNWACEYFSGASGGGVAGTNGVVGVPTISINTTIANTLLIQEQMSVANAGNSVTGQLLKAVIY